MDQKLATIIGIVGVLIIVISVSVSIFLNYKNKADIEKGTIFPPWPSKCPDYWTVVGENKCKNVYKIGDCKSGDTDNVMDFNDPIFTGKNGEHYKCNWAKKCNAPWEGVDNIC